MGKSTLLFDNDKCRLKFSNGVNSAVITPLVRKQGFFDGWLLLDEVVTDTNDLERRGLAKNLVNSDMNEQKVKLTLLRTSKNNIFKYLYTNFCTKGRFVLPNGYRAYS